MKKYCTLIALMLSSLGLSAQSITKLTSSTVSGAVCPGSATSYEVSVPSGLTSCQIVWSATNGQVTPDGSNQRKASVVWADTPGASGTVTATFTNCSNESNNGTAASKTELILSVKNQAWGSYGTSVNIDYCTKASVYISVPRMFVQGTGGIGQPTLTEVAYAWTLPSGWREVGTNRTGFFGTPQNYISIEPINCSIPGSVTVFGTLVGAGPFCNSSEKSATATISLNGANPVATVGPQSGYTGGSACNTTPVTFYATTSVALGCIGGYNWQYPASWSFVSQSGNSITLRPSGTSADSNPIRSTINFTCGSSITSGNYVPPFNAPVISLGTSTAICSGGTTVTLTNAGPNAQVNWAPSSNMTVNSGQGTPTAVIKAINSTTSATGTINATLTSCPSVSVPSKPVWVGKPYDFLVSGPNIVSSGSYNNYSAVVWNGQPSFATQGVGSNGFTWSFGYPPTSAGWNCFGCIGQTVLIQAGSQSTYVTGQVSNTCGGTQRNYEVFIDCPTNDCIEPFFVYPNPSSEELMVSSNSKDSNTITEVSLADSNGTVVYSEKSKGNGQFKISVRGFRNGTYYLSVTENGVTKKQHVIISH